MTISLIELPRDVLSRIVVLSSDITPFFLLHSILRKISRDEYIKACWLLRHWNISPSRNRKSKSLPIRTLSMPGFVTVQFLSIIQKRNFNLNTEDDLLFRIVGMKSSLPEIRYLIENSSVNINAGNGCVLLHNIKANKTDVVEYLLDNSATDIQLEYLIEYIIESGNLELLKYVIEDKGFSIQAASNLTYYGDPMRVSARLGRIAFIQYLVPHYAKMAHFQRSDYALVMIDASLHNQRATLHYLLQTYKDVITKSVIVEILRSAAEFGHTNIVKYVMQEYSSMFSLSDKDSESVFTVLTKACQTGSLEIFETVHTAYPSVINTLHHLTFLLRTSLRHGHVHITRFLVKTSNHDLDFLKNDQESLFANAIYQGHVSSVEFLHEIGCKIEECVVDEFFKYAQRCGYMELADHLALFMKRDGAAMK